MEPSDDEKSDPFLNDPETDVISESEDPDYCCDENLEWKNDENSRNQFSLSQVSLQSPNNISDLTSTSNPFHSSIQRIVKGELNIFHFI